jgi:hypothetical protein
LKRETDARNPEPDLRAPLSARLIDADLASGAMLEDPVTLGETAFAVIRQGKAQTEAGPAGPLRQSLQAVARCG